MPHPLSRVLEQLEAATREQRAAWRESGRAAELITPLPSGAIVVLSKNPYSEFLTGGSPGPFKLSILAEGGTVLSSLDAAVGGEFYDRLQGLYRVAKAQAADVDQQLGQVERELAGLRGRLAV